MYKYYIKRVIDIVVSFALMIVFVPVMALIFACLLVVNNGKPLFLQKRVGKNEVLFTLIKFRTLADKFDENGVLLPDHLRSTKIGKMLRKSSLDELPQLLNVLLGDMSLIGPRPLLIKYLPYYTAMERKRHDLKPGISGLAQINGRNELKWSRRLALDVYYVKHASLRLDAIIFLKTIGKILRASDVIFDKPYTIADLDDERRVW
jgi:undecaprenyl phosphate N,N'-diacetylbacillosamine 1-phosphate transferase